LDSRNKKYWSEGWERRKVSIPYLAVLLIWIPENLFTPPVTLTEEANVSGLVLGDFRQSVLLGWLSVT
jgi:hypothetical protein